MTEVEVKALAALIHMRDELESFADEFDNGKENGAFEFITIRFGLEDNEGGGQGYRDDVRINRKLAATWCRRGVEMCSGMLEAGGVRPTPDGGGTEE